MSKIASPSSIKPVTIEVAGDGQYHSMGTPSSILHRFLTRCPYRFYRFLSDLDDMVENIPDDLERVRIGSVLFKRFLSQADWITKVLPVPDPETRSTAKVLYDEPGYPFAVQIMAWLPQDSPVHCHANWSLVAFLGGEMAGYEENTFWSRQDDGSKPDYAYIEPISQTILKPGDVVGFTSDAIHSIRSIPGNYGEQSKPTYTFNIFGETDFAKRLQFDPIHHCSHPF